LNNLSKLQSPCMGTDRQGKQVVSIPHHLKNHSELAFLYDNFPIVFVKKNMIPYFYIENFRCSFDDLNTSSTCDFCTTKKFHKTHHINESLEILKYLINDVHYIDELMEIINFNGGYKERDNRYERESNN